MAHWRSLAKGWRVGKWRAQLREIILVVSGPSLESEKADSGPWSVWEDHFLFLGGMGGYSISGEVGIVVWWGWKGFGEGPGANKYGIKFAGLRGCGCFYLASAAENATRCCPSSVPLGRT